MKNPIYRLASDDAPGAVTPVGDAAGRGDELGVWLCAALVRGESGDGGREVMVEHVVGQRRAICWSGTLADQPFLPDPRSWTPTAWSRLSEVCGRVLDRIGTGETTLCIRPHSTHVLSDPRSCLTFLNQHEGQPLEVLLDPAAMFTEAMLDAAEDHLLRMFSVLGAHGQVAGVVLANVERGGDRTDEDAGSDSGGGAALTARPLHSGAIDPGLLVGIASRCVPADMPLILLGDGVDEQIETLARYWRGS